MVSFEIYERDNKTFHLNIENILFVIIVVLGILFEFKILLPYIKYIFICSIIIGFILTFINMFRVKPLYGKLNGKIIFDSEFIQINDQVYPIENINKIFLRMNDFKGLEYITIKPSFYPRLSNGTNNIVRLELKNGEKTTTFFKSDSEFDYFKLRPFIISLLHYNLLSIEDGRKVLRLDNDFELIKITNEVNKKELNN